MVGYENWVGWDRTLGMLEGILLGGSDGLKFHTVDSLNLLILPYRCREFKEWGIPSRSNKSRGG